MISRLSATSRLKYPAISMNPSTQLIKAYRSVQTNSPAIDSISKGDNKFRRKLNELILWYEQLTGMDEVRMVQNRVIEAQDRFVAAQECRRKLASELLAVQSKLKEIQADLTTTSRGEERYIQLVTEEFKILKDERRMTTEFALVERDERDSFNMLSSRLKESQEKERARAERVKYWSIIGSIFGTVLGIFGSSINNELKMRELRKLVYEATATNSPTNLQNISSLLVDVRDSLRQNVGSVFGVDQQKSNELYHCISGIDGEVKDLRKMFNEARKADSHLVLVPSDLHELLDSQKVEIRNIVIAASVVIVCLTLISSILQR
ncbi:Coiled-coil domain containing 51 [Nesidiocoris tenuis]|uniref:Coiled-coil domain containing 51 n=1 Tax=Nesidiocoris tenuis TaxID=355587 RepID=A0ABN7ASH0_9HEMI|nr:Coiled-coil domain containing 51 [Nesidiocoris tenuis]